MALDDNFMVFLVTAILVVLVAVVALPSNRRIEKDPSTAFRGGRRAMIILASLFSLVMGLVLAILGIGQNAKVVIGDINMVQIGGLSLIVMAAVLIVASISTRRQVRRAGRGEEEVVLDVAIVGSRPTAPDPQGPRPGLPQWPVPPARGPRGPPGDDRLPPPPPRVPRQAPPFDDGAYEYGVPPPGEGAHPPRRPPPRRRPPPG